MASPCRSNGTLGRPVSPPEVQHSLSAGRPPHTPPTLSTAISLRTGGALRDLSAEDARPGRGLDVRTQEGPQAGLSPGTSVTNPLHNPFPSTANDLAQAGSSSEVDAMPGKSHSFHDGAGSGSGSASGNIASPSPSAGPTLDSIPFPITVEEYLAASELLPAMRCGLGAELSPLAWAVFGETKMCSDKMLVLGVLPGFKTKTPNCNGRRPILLATGEQWWTPCMLSVCVSLPSILTTVGYRGHCHWVCILISWLLWLAVLVTMFVCAFVDPGIVPRRLRRDIKDLGDVAVVRVPAPNAKTVLAKMEKREQSRLNAIAAAGGEAEGEGQPAALLYSNKRYFDSETGALLTEKPARAVSTDETPTVSFPLTYCQTCCIFKGPRTHHCTSCDNCVDGFDHHCVWTNCCIGKNNYPLFMSALLTLHLLGLYHFVLTVAVNVHYLMIHPHNNMKDLLDAMYYMPVVMYASIFCFGLFFSSLLIGHLVMRFVGVTTVELLKRRYWRWGGTLENNPWSRGWFINLFYRYFRFEEWEDTRNYYGVTVETALEDRKLDWRIALPDAEQARLLKLERQAAKDGVSLTAANVEEMKGKLASATQTSRFRRLSTQNGSDVRSPSG